ncbi:hypothetical protein A4A49_07143 [Nicotiana attenuata]|uniref:Uncharacterized protein n=2 Tax=Nicotiana attenuata TaxID=49451 RepID=A0A314KWV6_NICAT|nr:hypothetical protein A4A49_07143 [Nicotiana attenuata]
MFEYMALHLNLRAIPKGFLTRTYPCKAIRLLIQLTGKSIAGCQATTLSYGNTNEPKVTLLSKLYKNCALHGATRLEHD